MGGDRHVGGLVPEYLREALVLHNAYVSRAPM